MNPNIYEKYKKFSDEELLNIYEYLYSQYTEEAVAVAKGVIEERNISKTIWHYRKNDEQVGPVSRDAVFQMALEGELSPIDYIWFEGLEKWVLAKDIPRIVFGKKKTESKRNPSEPPPFTPKEEKVDHIHIKEESYEGVKIAAILFFIQSAIWGLLSLLQLFYAFTYGFYDTALIAGWNIVMTVAGIFIGIGVWKRREWGYNWGVGTSSIGLIWYGIEALSIQNYFLLVFVPIYIAIIALLYKNKSAFNISAEEKKSSNFFDISDEQYDKIFKDIDSK
ncbi:DUF4339 domain-containing protein [Wukongibacter sp. M2B1]|uniref:DUF4339 domain-containing protein n=1 Tax=Wukongibacter sp. M2B1 TaxID=3088895 RepID=UPI003D798826